MAFGRLHVVLESRETLWLQQAALRFPGAIVRGVDDQPPVIRLRHESNGKSRPFPGSPRTVWNEKTELTPTDSGFVLEGETFSGTWEAATGQARVRGPMALYPAEHVLLQALPRVYQPGLIFHAAMIRGEGQAWLAAGKSGAGKSTLAALAGNQALADESVGVRPEGEQWLAESFPFARHTPGRAPLAGIALLRQGPENRRHRLLPGQALRQLSQHLWWPMTSSAGVKSCLGRLSGLIDQVPVEVLEFRPEASALEVLMQIGQENITP